MKRCEAPGCRRRVEETFCAVHSSRVEVAELREAVEDLGAEVKELRENLRALQEREAVLNARVLHLGRYTSEAGSQNSNGVPPGSIPGPGAVFAGLETSSKEKGPG